MRTELTIPERDLMHLEDACNLLKLPILAVNKLSEFSVFVTIEHDHAHTLFYLAQITENNKLGIKWN